MKIGVTGANGFVGKHVIRALADAGLQPVALVRRDDRKIDGATETRRIPSLGGDMNQDMLHACLNGLDGIVHLAAMVHQMHSGEETAFVKANVVGSVTLANACAAAGVPRFIFMSSVKAAGNRTRDRPLNAETPPAPEDAYGRSKLAAERRLAEIAAHTDMKIIILRPTFVYGWPYSGNFKAVISALQRGIPLPLAGIKNRRDMTFVGNLADAVRAALAAPDIGFGPYFLSDGKAISTPALFQKTGRAFASPARLFYLPNWALRMIGALTGRVEMIDRLTENLEVDAKPFRRDAGWQPPYNLDQGLRMTAGSSAYSKTEWDVLDA